MDDRGLATAIRTYSRDIVRKETWDEICDRVSRGNCAHGPVSSDEERDLYNGIRAGILLPGGRHMWSVGAPGREFISNCHTTGWNAGFSAHYRYMFLRLAEGGGVGSNYSNHEMRLPHTLHMPDVMFEMHSSHDDYASCVPIIERMNFGKKYSSPISIRDNRNGWADALSLVLDAIESGAPSRITLDFTHIRARGKPLHGSGGTASGPQALMEMISDIIGHTNKQMLSNQPADSCYAIRIAHAISRAVMAGNVRRSAQIALKHWRDPDIMEFVGLKEREDISTINMSVIATPGFWDSDILMHVVRGMKKCGEPGIFNWCAAQNDHRDDRIPFRLFAVNPCGELPLPQWGSCCLGSVNAADSTTYEFELMTRFLMRGTCFPSQDKRSQAIINEYRIIGTGLTGFADWMALHGHQYRSAIMRNPTVADQLRVWYQTVRRAANMYAEEMGVPLPLRVTCCAPTGTMSKLHGISEGIQPHLYDYFVNRVIYADTDPDVRRLEQAGYHVEASVNAPNSVCVEFPMRAGILRTVEQIETAADIGIEGQLAMQAMVQECYADSSISYTVNFDAEAYTDEQIADLLRRYGPMLKGTTLMPLCGGRYRQLPQERITREQYYEMADKLGHRHGAAGECVGGVCQSRDFM